MSSIFDEPRFNQALFLPRRDEVPAPPNSRDLFVDVADDARVHVRLHRRPGTRAALLLFHGNGEYVWNYNAVAGHFANAGVDLVVADFRGYGRSTGAPTLRHCVNDAGPVFDAVTAALGERPLLVMGRSLGSTCAAELCRRDGARVRGLVLDSAPADLRGTLQRRGYPASTVISEADRHDFDPLPKLAFCTAPALLLHGEHDTLIPPSEARLSLDALGSADKQLVILPGCGHNNLSEHPRYWEALAAFVARVVV